MNFYLSVSTDADIIENTDIKFYAGAYKSADEFNGAESIANSENDELAAV